MFRRKEDTTRKFVGRGSLIVVRCSIKVLGLFQTGQCNFPNHRAIDRLISSLRNRRNIRKKDKKYCEPVPFSSRVDSSFILHDMGSRKRALRCFWLLRGRYDRCQTNVESRILRLGVGSAGQERRERSHTQYLSSDKR